MDFIFSEMHATWLGRLLFRMLPIS
jgi:hypothetical protein